MADWQLLEEEEQTWVPSSAELLMRAHALFASPAYREWVYTRGYNTSEKAMAHIASGYSQGLSGEQIFQNSLALLERR